MKPMGRCSQCRYYGEVENRKDVGECRRYPPAVIIAKAQLRPLHAAKVHLTSGEIRSVVEGFRGADSLAVHLPPGLGRLELRGVRPGRGAQLTVGTWGLVAAMLALAVASYLVLKRAVIRRRFRAFRARCADCDFSQETENREPARTAAILHNLKTRHVVFIEGRR